MYAWADKGECVQRMEREDYCVQSAVEIPVLTFLTCWEVRPYSSRALQHNLNFKGMKNITCMEEAMLLVVKDLTLFLER